MMGVGMAPLSDLWRRYVDEKYDWRKDKEAICRDMAAASRDVLAFLAWADLQRETVRQLPAIVLLRRVFAENFELVTGKAIPGNERATSSVQNPHDPDAQWSTKSTIKHKAWVGFKVQVAETVADGESRKKGDPSANFIVSMTTQSATGSDKAGMDQALAEQSDQGLAAPAVIYADGAYISAPDLAQAAREKRELRGPAPSPPKHDKLFQSTDFDVDMENMRAVCPGGKTSTNCSRLHVATTGITNYRIEWNNGICDACPLRNRCIAPRICHRTLLVGEHHAHLQRRRREMKTDAFTQDMRKRSAIEGTHSELGRAHGLKRSRYRGLAKQRLQNWFIGAACNIKRLHRIICWEKTGKTP
jgi:hypothetical protein